MSHVWNRDLVETPVSVEQYLWHVDSLALGKPTYIRSGFFTASFRLTKIAVCPICREDTWVRIDMLSIKKWHSEKGTRNDFFTLDRFAYRRFETQGENYKTCMHYFITDVFIFFNGQPPEKRIEELKFSRKFGPERPYLMGELIDRFSSLNATLHAVPICRIIDDRFVPTYNAFLVTYFVEAHEFKELKEYIASTKDEPYSYLIHPRERGKDRNGNDPIEWWNLEAYARRKRLYWLAPETEDYPLTSIENAPFPFADLTGRMYPIHEDCPPLTRR